MLRWMEIRHQDRSRRRDQRNAVKAAESVPNAVPVAAAGGGTPEGRNTFWLECYQVIVRVGWIFKTETIIMPAVLDAVVDSGLLRGLLPILNRGGQSLPPLLFAGPLSRRPLKKWTLVRTSLAMAACFAVLAVAWGPLAARRPDLLATLFLSLYFAFSVANGLTQLVSASLTGKLIPAGRRGRAMVVSTTVGSGLAIAAAAWLLGPWLEMADGFQRIFGATAAFFAVAAFVPAMLDEPPDEAAADAGAAGGWRGFLADWGGTLRRDRALARLAAVAVCFSAVFMLFPHYQAFARDRLGSPIASLLTWVVVQNAATAAASVVAGPVTDRRGTRIVLVWIVALSAATPLAVIALSLAPQAAAVDWFWAVYALLGLNPIALRTFTNYALELAPRPADHPRYVSIVGAALAVPFVLSPLVGLGVDVLGFRPVFLAGAVAIAIGAVVAGGLPEPRRP
jgi:MFS family permease